jgi:hypothetical protein
MSESLEQLAAHEPSGPPATPDESGLAADRAIFIYGAKLTVDGLRMAI